VNDLRKDFMINHKESDLHHPGTETERGPPNLQSDALPVDRTALHICIYVNNLNIYETTLYNTSPYLISSGLIIIVTFTVSYLR
jgi:hypothetical protein